MPIVTHNVPAAHRAPAKTAMQIRYTEFNSPLGRFRVGVSERGVRAAGFIDNRDDATTGKDWRFVAALDHPAVHQLRGYFAGEVRHFDVSLDPLGTPFQNTVWRALCAVPFASTTSYSAIAQRLGKPTATRAVGAANGQNPIAIIVPCHRVIGKDGTLTGYAAGLERKRWLLAHEAKQAGGQLALGTLLD